MIDMIQKATIKKTYKEIPETLVYEVLEGKPVYYKNYKDVLNGIKNLDDIMGSSSLQSFILTYIVKQIIKHLDTEEFKNSYDKFTQTQKQFIKNTFHTIEKQEKIIEESLKQGIKFS